MKTFELRYKYDPANAVLVEADTWKCDGVQLQFTREERHRFTSRTTDLEVGRVDCTVVLLVNFAEVLSVRQAPEKPADTRTPLEKMAEGYNE